MTNTEISKLKSCKTMKDLNNFVKTIPLDNVYQKRFVMWWKNQMNPNNIKKLKFEDAYIKVWSFMMQQENPVYLGKTSDKCKVKLTAIHGMECSGH